MSKLLILGAGQHGQVVKETAELMDCFTKIDFLDDKSELAIGKIDEYINIGKNYDYLFVAIGNNELRLNLLESIKSKNYKIATIIHPSAMISKSAKIEEGTIIEAGAIINSHTEIKEGCIISLGTIIDHNVVINKGSHIRPGVIILSNKIINELTEVKE